MTGTSGPRLVSDPGIRKAVTFLDLDQTGIPQGKISIIGGPPGANKSTLVVAVAAEMSRKRQVSLLALRDDDWEDATLPRLEAAGADLKYVHRLEGNLSLPENLPWLEDQIKSTGAKLIAFDPVQAVFGPGMSESRPQAVYAGLYPLKVFAAELGCSILFVRHTIKSVSGKGDPLNVIGGAIGGLPALCRAAFIVAKCAADPSKRYVACVKSSLGEAPVTAIYQIESVDLPARDGQVALEDIVTMRYVGASFLDAQGVLAQMNSSYAQEDQAFKHTAAADFLREVLADGKEHSRSSVLKAAEAKKISRSTLDRAAKVVGVTYKKRSRLFGEASWQLSVK